MRSMVADEGVRCMLVLTLVDGGAVLLSAVVVSLGAFAK